MLRAPEFWNRPPGPASALLAPAGALYALGTALRRRLVTTWRAPVPVICVGNLVAGGGGKTPVALSIGTALAAQGMRPHFLSRGYGGQARGPLRVDPDRHSAGDVGDEPLLLARVGPAWVSRDRAAGARAAVEGGAGAIVMDDGFQNDALAKDIALLVADGSYGFGNGRVIPAGPLREGLDGGLARADALIVVGTDSAGIGEQVAGRLPVVAARLVPGPEADGIAGRRVVAFAGIARPDKFYRTLGDLGCTVVESRDFPDHHRYRPEEIAALRRRATEAGALCVTTEKDAVRLPEAARADVHVLPVVLEWAEPDSLRRLLARIVPDG
jgi:tetraacyldisaccharide 4'-kinase